MEIRIKSTSICSKSPSNEVISIGEKVQVKLKEELNINATLINPRFITGIDEDMLNELIGSHKVVITLEDRILDG